MTITPFLEVSPPTSPNRAASSSAAFPSYPVFLGQEAGNSEAASHGRGDFLRRVWAPEWRSAVIITDTTTQSLFEADVKASLAHVPHVDALTFAPGENHKTRATKSQLEDAMLEAGADRHTCVVAVGGGIVLDLAGFVAATFMRGLPHLNIATTLLAQVDAAIGGKTAVNTPQGKNLVGAVHHPRAVYIDRAALRHLPAVEHKNGLAEALKHAVLSDASLFAELETWAAGSASKTLSREHTARCIEIKAEVVAADHRDKGKRGILNYGHTAAHAIEHATDHRTPHGLAVASGMIIEARVATRRGAFPAADLERLIALNKALGLPTTPPCSFEQAQPYFSRDKKTVGGDIRCAIPNALGRTEAHSDGSWLCSVSEQELNEAWAS